ncbi:MAG: hypothetical protein C5B51_09975 [Terriglobia bacterium]|nr:MAG: hypothetical protein C5B51_09975 [Terriglobia bacterium]
MGSNVITVFDLDREIRLTAFLNNAKPDLSPANKRATAERLVEQQLIRREIALGQYPVPEPSAVGPLPANLPRIAEYGLTEQEVKDALLWQLTLLRFVEVRFRPGIQVSDQKIRDYFEKVVEPAARAARPGTDITIEDYREQIEATLTGQRSDRELNTWMNDARKRTDIIYHDEVFQ